MDSPTAPNPANPNAQDQFVDAVQGPQIKLKLKVLQSKIKIKVLQPKLKFKVRLKVLQTTMLKLVKKYLAASKPTSPSTTVPTGLVVSAPWVFYQNSIGKKPEFSGKPEEDAESHLVSTRDWMEAHNFPDKVKVRHFHLMLTGEARLWYESLAPLDNDWPALQNKFRWQYSKIDNTPEQMFHAWRTFKFDKNTDTIDS